MENRALGVEGVEVGATRWSQGRWAQLPEGSRRAPVGMGPFCVLTENIQAPARDRITHTHPEDEYEQTEKSEQDG